MSKTKSHIFDSNSGLIVFNIQEMLLFDVCLSTSDFSNISHPLFSILLNKANEELFCIKHGSRSQRHTHFDVIVLLTALSAELKIICGLVLM